MRLFVSLIIAVIATPIGIAGAGGFGGFSADGSTYLELPNRVCTPVSARDKHASPACSVVSASAIASAGFRLGSKLDGGGAAYRASLAGNNVVVQTKAGQRVINWTSMETIDRIVALYANPSRSMLAVEIAVRIMGRPRTQVIGFRLRAHIGTATTTTTTTPTTSTPTTTTATLPTAVAGPTLSKKQRRELDRLLRLARNHNLRRRYKRALAAIARAEAIDPANPEAQFRRAVALVGMKQDQQALALITKMSHSGRPTGMRWWLEVRFHKAFKRLFINPAFRVASGLDETIKRPRTAYETLMGYGGHWEQSGKSCQREQINLRLNRTNNKFKMVIQSKCGSDDWITRLDGTFAINEPRQLALTFPNPGRKANVVRIQIGTCRGIPNEPCLQTKVAGMAMTLLSVRR